MLQKRRRKETMTSLTEEKKKSGNELRLRGSDGNWTRWFCLLEVAVMEHENLIMKQEKVAVVGYQNLREQEEVSRKREAPTEDDESIRRNKRQRSQHINPARQISPPVEMPDVFKKAILEKKGSDLVLVIQKNLFQTDINSGQGRLSIPMSRLVNEFLDVREKELLSQRKEKGVNEMNVTLLEPSLREISLRLRRWDMKKASGNVSSTYVLVHGWNSVVRRNGLKKDDLVQLWAFRVHNSLWFALTVLEHGGGAQVEVEA